MIPYPEIPPYFLKIGNVEFRWYGLMYALGFLVGVLLVRFLLRHSKRFSKTPLKEAMIMDLVFYVLLGVILGGRIGYVLFYNLSYYIQHPLSIFTLWEGGMSFHGGLIGVIIAGLLFCKTRNIPIYDMGDVLVLVVPIGLGLGRIGNFINGELYGRVTNVPWCMQFPAGVGCRHPSQLYEFLLEGVFLFFVLWVIKDRKIPKGTLFWLFFLFYGGFRFLVEFTREPDAQLGILFAGLTMGQLLSIPLLLAGIIGLFAVFKHSTK